MSPIYQVSIGSDDRYHASGPGDGMGYYSGELYGHMRLSNKKDCEAAVHIANEAYKQGYEAAQAAIRKALNL